MPVSRKTKRKHRASDIMPMTNLPVADREPQNPPPRISKKIHPSVPFIGVILLLLYLGLNAWIYFYGTTIFTFNPFLKKAAETISIVKKQGFGAFQTTPPKPPQREGVLYPLPPISQSWEFEHGSGVTGPKAQTATVNPLGPAKGGSQTVSLTAKHDSPISATATLYTDTKQKSADMKRVSGADTNGTWSVTWTVDDTVNTTYHIDFELKSRTGNWKGALTFR